MTCRTLNIRKWKAFLAGIAVLLITGTIAFAHGHGKGRTKIDFRLMTGDPSSSRLFAKIDVSGALSSNANMTAFKHGNGGGHGNSGNHGHHGDNDNHGDNGHHGNGNHGNHGGGEGEGGHGGITSNGNGHHGKSGNFALANSTITLTIGSASFTGTADGRGRVSTPFNAKLTANGEILQIQAYGLNLEELFPIDPTDGDHQVTVEISVTATSAATATTAASTTVLSDQQVTFFYTVKDGRAKGRNF
jgi:hypothetical protein